MVLALLVLSTAFMAAFFLVGEDLRQDYRVASRGDRERTAIALTDTHVAWLEDAQPGGAVLVYDLATKKRITLEPRNATLHGPLAMSGDLVAWMDNATGAPRIRVHDLAKNASAYAGAPGDALVLLNRSLVGRTLLAWGSVVGESRVGLWRLEVSVSGEGFGGTATAAVPVAATPDATLSGGRVWWRDGAALHAADAITGAPGANLTATGPVTHFDVAGDLVVWSEVSGNHRRAFWANLANGTRGAVSASPADQNIPAVHGSQVIFVQHDGLVRWVDLASGRERVLPARTQENRNLDLTATMASWLSGTIDGHNVFLTPVPPAG